MKPSETVSSRGMRRPRGVHFQQTLTALTVGVLVSVLPAQGAGEVSAIAWSDEELAAVAPGYVTSIHASARRPRPENQFCSGMLIAPSWVLTAAHCYDDTAGVATSVLVNKTIVRRVIAVHVPGRYADLPSTDAYLSGADIALLRLARPVEGVAPVLLPSGADPSKSGTARVYGFGLDENGKDPQRLGARTVEIEAGEWAARLYPFLPARQISAWGERTVEVDAAPGQSVTTSRADGAVCEGDSGGPLVVDSPSGDVVIGVVSYGADCAKPVPSVYTKVFAHLKWVRRVMRTAK